MSPQYYSGTASVHRYVEPFGPAPLAFHGSEPALFLSDRRGATRLVTLDLAGGELRLGPEVAPEPTQVGYSSLGTLGDGGLVWAERRSPEQTKIMWLPPPPADQPREVCTIESEAGEATVSLGRYRGTTGAWALWTTGYGEHYLYGCRVETGDVRVLQWLGPYGFLSADVVEDGVLTTRGKVPLPG